MIRDIRKKCNRQNGGYYCDKQSAYSNGFKDGAEQAIRQCIAFVNDCDKSEHPSDIADKLQAELIAFLDT